MGIITIMILIKWQNYIHPQSILTILFKISDIDYFQFNVTLYLVKIINISNNKFFCTFNEINKKKNFRTITPGKIWTKNIDKFIHIILI